MKVFFVVIWAIAGQAPQEFEYPSMRACEKARAMWLQWTQEVSRCLMRETA